MPNDSPLRVISYHLKVLPAEPAITTGASPSRGASHLMCSRSPRAVATTLHLLANLPLYVSRCWLRSSQGCSAGRAKWWHRLIFTRIVCHLPERHISGATLPHFARLRAMHFAHSTSGNFCGYHKNLLVPFLIYRQRANSQGETQWLSDRKGFAPSSGRHPKSWICVLSIYYSTMLIPHWLF